MANSKITKRVVDAAKPEANRYVIWDSELKGFGLRVYPAKDGESGQKSYVVKYRFEGEQRWQTIGVHGAKWTAELARQEATRILRDAASGVDPMKEKRLANELPKMKELCALYLAEGVAHKKPATIKADRSRIKHHIVPILGKVRVDQLSKADCTKLFMHVKEGKTAGKKEGAAKQGRIIVVGGEGAAKQCVMLLSTLMTFAIERGYRTDNPAQGFKKPRGKKLERFLSEIEITRLGEALIHEETTNGNPYSVAALRILALTGARRGEMEQLKWREVNFDRDMLELADSKTGAKPI